MRPAMERPLEVQVTARWLACRLCFSVIVLQDAVSVSVLIRRAPHASGWPRLISPLLVQGYSHQPRNVEGAES